MRTVSKIKLLVHVRLGYPLEVRPHYDRWREVGGSLQLLRLGILYPERIGVRYEMPSGLTDNNITSDSIAVSQILPSLT